MKFSSRCKLNSLQQEISGKRLHLLPLFDSINNFLTNSNEGESQRTSIEESCFPLLISEEKASMISQIKNKKIQSLLMGCHPFLNSFHSLNSIEFSIKLINIICELFNDEIDANTIEPLILICFDICIKYYDNRESGLLLWIQRELKQSEAFTTFFEKGCNLINPALLEGSFLQVLCIEFPSSGIADEIFNIMENIDKETSNFLKDHMTNISNLIFLQFLESLENPLTYELMKNSYKFGLALISMFLKYSDKEEQHNELERSNPDLKEEKVVSFKNSLISLLSKDSENRNEMSTPEKSQQTKDSQNYSRQNSICTTTGTIDNEVDYFFPPTLEIPKKRISKFICKEDDLIEKKENLNKKNQKKRIS